MLKNPCPACGKKVSRWHMKVKGTFLSPTYHCPHCEVRLGDDNVSSFFWRLGTILTMTYLLVDYLEHSSKYFAYVDKNVFLYAALVLGVISAIKMKYVIVDGDKKVSNKNESM